MQVKNKTVMIVICIVICGILWCAWTSCGAEILPVRDDKIRFVCFYQVQKDGPDTESVAFEIPAGTDAFEALKDHIQSISARHDSFCAVNYRSKRQQGANIRITYLSGTEQEPKVIELSMHSGDACFEYSVIPVGSGSTKETSLRGKDMVQWYNTLFDLLEQAEEYIVN